MQDYIEFAEKNGVKLSDIGPCQFCGAQTKRGVHECIEIFHLGFQNSSYSTIESQFYRFFIVDAHTLQHPEIHGRWNNHFHLSRLHLIFNYEIKWSYALSPKLSDYLNQYKIKKQDEYLVPPKILQRGKITSTDILGLSTNEKACKALIEQWALEVYNKWNAHHQVADVIAKGFLKMD